MIDVLLIDPPTHVPTRPSLGIAWLSAHLKSQGYSVAVRDINAEMYAAGAEGDYSLERLLQWRDNPTWGTAHFDDDVKVIGFSLMYDSQVAWTYLATQMIKSCKLGTLKTVVLGGSLLTDLETARRVFPYADHICIGDGEQFMSRVMQGDNPEPPIHTSFDEIKTPDYTWANWKLYSRTRGDDKSVFYSATRGCAYGKCTFCNRIHTLQLDYQRRTKEQIRSDLCEIRGQMYGLRRIWFVDEFLPPPVLRDVADVFKETWTLNDLEWGCFLRPSPKYDRAFVQHLKECGLRWVRFGVETMNQRLLDMLQKGTKVDDIYHNVITFAARAIHVTALCMSNLPTQTDAEILEDRKQFEALRVLSTVRVSRFVLMKQSAMYRLFLGSHGLDKDEVDAAMEHSPNKDKCSIENGKPVPLIDTSKQTTMHDWNIAEPVNGRMMV